ncbi:hypothetical protein ABPG74_008459 [Tetrahymena malaccensis]
MAEDDYWQEIWKSAKSNICLLAFMIPFLLHMLEIKVQFSFTDYKSYFWSFFVIYVSVTYGYVCDHLEGLIIFALLFTVQVHSAIFFFQQTIFPLTDLQKVVMTFYLVSICLFMNIMIREYRLKKKNSKVVQKKLLFFVNQCSGTVFAQILFLELGVIDFSNYGKILNEYPWDLATYIIFNLLSLFGFIVGIYQMFSKMKKLSKNTYQLQRHWFYFTSLLACVCFLILKWEIATIPELFILLSTYFYIFIVIFSWQSQKWFLVLSLAQGITEIVIQFKYHGDIDDPWIRICSSINQMFFTRSLAWVFIKVYTHFHGELDEKQKEVVGVFFDM